MNKKPIAAIIIAKAKGKPMPEEEEPRDLEITAEELISAFKAGDAKAVAAILKDFISMVNYEEE